VPECQAALNTQRVQKTLHIDLKGLHTCQYIDVQFAGRSITSLCDRGSEVFLMVESLHNELEDNELTVSEVPSSLSVLLGRKRTGKGRHLLNFRSQKSDTNMFVICPQINKSGINRHRFPG
jgi:hypothetical protein